MEEVQEAKTLAALPNLAGWLDRVSPTVTAAYLGVILLAFVAIPVLAYTWMGTPFLGGFVEHTLIFNDIGPTQPGNAAWEAYNQGLGFGDQLLAIAGQEVRNTRQMQDVLDGFHPGETIPITVLSESGKLRELDILLHAFPTADRIAYHYTLYMVGLVYLGCGLWVFRLRRADAAGRAFALFTASVALMLASLFEVNTTHYLTPLWTLAVAVMAGALLNLVFVFPRQAKILTRWPFLRWAGYVPALALFLNALPTLFNFNRPTAYASAWNAEYLYAALAVAIFMIVTLLQRFTSPSPIVHEQTRIVLWSSLSFLPLSLWALGDAVAFIPDVLHNVPLPYLMVPRGLFQVAIAYAVLRYRLLNTDYVVSRAVLYASLSVLAASGYALLVSGISMIFGTVVNANNPFLIGMLVFVLALALNPLRERMQRVIDRLFFRGQAAHRELLENFAGELTQIVELPTIVALVRKYVTEVLQPVHFHVYVHDPLSDYYVATLDEKKRPTTDIRFGANSPLPQTLSRHQKTLFLAEADTLPLALLTERTRLALLGAQLFTALPGQARLTGWLALGPRRSGEPYTSRDINFLAALSDQAALAVERAQVLADKDRRVHEMNVLTRVAQGVNVTLAFDDILELIFAQTIQIIPTRDFRITLFNEMTQTLHHAFFVEDDDRIGEKEDMPLPTGRGLEQEVIRSRRAIVTDDYVSECRRRGVLVDADDLFAWMSVPLNAGAETIGVLSLGNRDGAIVYTDGQRGLLQAIADQAAGAIVKARLLQETERRARQLATLNEVARSLTSTLDSDPLLNRIMQSAVDILNCEAGSLLLIDDETGELIFEVVVSPVAVQLKGTRLKPGVGLVGKAVETREPVIVNDVMDSSEWHDDTDKETGFQTRSILVVPMLVQDRVLGVLEVMNKKDRLPFSYDDRELLTAFTGQAAVAIENARLYTLTDQKLSVRVEELSVMQRIDRELNTSLDVARAMRITLEWAMRQSGAAAGLVGVVEEEGIRVMAQEGLDSELAPYEDAPLPIDFPAIREAIETVQPQQLYLDDTASGTGFLSDAQAQIVIPIRREGEVIGILLLESKESGRYRDDIQEFLIRLGDHAAIAISNAQLYGAVQQANIAKSDFISFISHELKTPMTSIRGFTDLLAAGSVGPINEAQENFLVTIRTNVTRMSTLVSDLADLSRIEAGRLRLEFSACDIREVIDEVLRSAQAGIDEKEQNFIIEIPDDIPPIWTDRVRLVQALTNLVNNAYKYTPEQGDLFFYAEAAENQWDPQGAPQVVHIRVRDTGIGISEEDQPKIFRQYFRTAESREFATGTGLGLNITKSLVELQGGQLWFDSVQGEGSTFHFTVPIAEEEEGD